MVGFNKSVFVIFTLDEKLMAKWVMSLLYLFRNFVFVWVVVQGKGQSGTRLPSTKP